MAFNLPKSPFNLTETTDPKKKTKTKPKPFVDPGLPENFTPIAPGTSDQIIKPYEGRAFVGTTGGGKRQPVGAAVTGITETGRSSEDRFVKGIVKAKSLIGSSQSSVIEGATIEQPRYRSSRRIGTLAKKRKA